MLEFINWSCQTIRPITNNQREKKTRTNKKLNESNNQVTRGEHFNRHGLHEGKEISICKNAKFKFTDQLIIRSKRQNSRCQRESKSAE